MTHMEEIYVVRWDTTMPHDVGFWWAFHQDEAEQRLKSLAAGGRHDNLTLWAVPVPEDFLSDRMAVRGWIYQSFERLPIQLDVQTYTLAEIRNGTGFPADVRFAVAP